MIDLRQRAQANKKGHPFSAMIVERSTSRLIVAVNKVITAKDPTAHAEIEAIRKAGKKGFNFEDCVMICSGEPCPMCATAIAWAGMKEVYYLDSHKIANSKGYRFDQDVQRVNRLLNLGLRIGRSARYVIVPVR
ncbi:MAG TPA: nucleoside deaminase [Patescibacteria group bacterium]|nr:nucleoside deaminase [Patescibacteria group bacterium]